MLLKICRPFLRLGHFKGKTRIEECLRRLLWRPDQLSIGRGLRMELDPQEWIQFQYIKGDLLEPKTLELLERLLEPGDVYIDVGSHVGLLTLVARQRVGEDGLVVAIEPQPYNAAKILTNWRINGFINLKLYSAAAGESGGEVWLKEQDPSDRALLSLQHQSKRNTEISYRTSLVGLNSVFEEHRFDRVGLLKIDVEGFELEVLKGLGMRIEAVENIIFEHLPCSEIEEKTEVIFLLEEMGFEILSVSGEVWVPGSKVPENNLWARRSNSSSPG